MAEQNKPGEGEKKDDPTNKGQAALGKKGAKRFRVKRRIVTPNGIVFVPGKKYTMTEDEIEAVALKHDFRESVS